MHRNEWIFKYTASKLAAAAEAKCNHHRDRLTWWRGQKEVVMAEVKESGIEVSESIAAAYTKNTGMGPQVMVRNDLQQKLTECHMKLKEHDQKVSEYDGWVQVLTANPEAQLELHHDDWLYFFAR